MSNSTRRKGFSFLSFLLGILIGIILIVGAIGGAVAFVMLNDLDTVFNIVGIDNSKDENGNNKLVNTDVDKGGVKTVWELFTAIGGFAGDFENKSVGDIEKLLPLAGGFVDDALAALSEFIELDRAEFTSVKFAEVGDYVQNVVLDLRPADLMEKFGMSVSDNQLLEAMLVGAEAEYVQVNGVKQPVRCQKGATGEENVYFYLGEDGKAYLVNKADDAYTATGTVFIGYNSETAELSGNYYYVNGDSANEKITENPITLRTFTEGGDALEPLNKIKIADMLSESNEMAEKVLGDITVGQLISGDADFEGIINGLELAAIMDVSPDNTIMSYLGYGLVDVKAVTGETYAYTAVYRPLKTEGEPVKADVDCFVEASEGKITRIYYTDGGESSDICGTTVSEVSARIDGVMSDIKIGSLMTISDDNKMLKKFENSTVNSLADDIGELSLNELYADEIYTAKNEDGSISRKSELRTAVEVVTDAESEELFSENYLYYEEINGVWKLAPNGGKLTLAQFEGRGDKVYKTYGAANALWNLMLYKSHENGGTVSSTEAAYTVNSVGDMINNVTTNINNATLRDLKDAGIIDIADDDLTKKFPGRDVEIGDMPLAEVLRRMIDLLDLYNESI